MIFERFSLAFLDLTNNFFASACSDSQNINLVGLTFDPKTFLVNSSYDSVCMAISALELWMPITGSYHSNKPLLMKKA